MEGGTRFTHERLWLHHTVEPNPDPNDFQRHCHDTYELIYVVHGAGRYIVEGTEYTMKSGTLLLLHPHAFHYVEIESGRLYDRYVIHFKDSALLSEARELLLRFESGNLGYGHFYSESCLPAPALRAFSGIDEIGHYSASESYLLARMVLSEIIFWLSTASPERELDRGEPLGLQVIRYLNTHLTEQNSLDELSRRFFVSKFYLCRAFREHNGVSILQYLTEKRIILAKQLLEEGETAVSAAVKAGFGDYSSFYRAYKKILGTSPKENKNHRKGGEKS